MNKILLILALLQLTMACPEEDHCSRCDLASKKCLQCENVIFNVKTNKCDPAQKPIENCRIYSQAEKPICLKCANGFGLNIEQTQCVKCEVEGCSRCNRDAKKCSACLSPKILDETWEKCVADDSVKNPDCEVNSSNQNSKTPFCLECKTGFSLKAGACQAETVPNCYEMVGDKCYSCRVGYYHNAEGKCTINGGGDKPVPPSRWWIWLLIAILIVLVVLGVIWFLKRNPEAHKHNSEALIA